MTSQGKHILRAFHGGCSNSQKATARWMALEWTEAARDEGRKAQEAATLAEPSDGIIWARAFFAQRRRGPKFLAPTRLGQTRPVIRSGEVKEKGKATPQSEQDLNLNDFLFLATIF